MESDSDYPFLERLGLDEQADARAIRRAYARELKLIDQERDPDAFQDLRACYETALSWAAWDARRRAQAETAAEAGSAGAAPRTPDPADGGEALAAPASAHAAPVAVPQLAPEPAAAAASEPAPAADAPPTLPQRLPEPAAPPPLQPAAAQPALQPAAAQPAPDGVAHAHVHAHAHADGEAPPPWDVGRALFDAFCAGLPNLAQRRLEPREQPCVDALQAALADERLLNFEARLSFEVHLAHLLADGWRSSHELLFPACAQVFAWDRDRRALARLGHAGQALDLALEERASFFAQDVQARSQQRDVLALLRQPDAPPDARIAEGMGALEQMMQRFPHWLPLIAPAANIAGWRERYRQRNGKPFSLDDMPAAAPPPPPRSRWNNAWVVWACVMGLISALRLLGGDSGGDHGRDAAARHASDEARRVVERLRREEARTTSGLASEDGGQMIERLRRAQGHGASGPAFADDARAAAPAQRQREQAQAQGLSPTQAQLEAVRRQIDYKPGPDARTGPVKVRFHVFLDARGKVVNVEKAEAVGDPAFIAAAEKALRDARPFPPATAKAFQITYSGAVHKVSRPAPAPVPEMAESPAQGVQAPPPPPDPEQR